LAGKYFSGQVHSVIYSNPDNAYYVLRMVLDTEKDAKGPFAESDITGVAGNVAGMALSPGVWFGFEGKWVQHPKYGKQLQITQAPVFKGGWDTGTVTKLLIGHGVGTRLARTLGEFFGDKLATALVDPATLEKCPGTDAATAIYLVAVWQDIRAYHQAVKFLRDTGIPQASIVTVWKHFGEDAESILATCPWALVEVPGFTWRNCEEVAGRLKLPPTGPGRLQAAVLAVCKEQRGMGSLYIEGKALLRGVSQITGEADAAEIAKAIKAAAKAKKIVAERVDGKIVMYEPWWHYTEQESADRLAARVEAWDGPRGKDHREAYAEALGAATPGAKTALDAGKDLRAVAAAALAGWASTAHITLSDLQTEGALNALVAPVSILTGLPGTGKTQTVKAIMRVLQDAGVNCLLLAPTGIAAKRAAQLTGATAETIHRAFKAQHPGDGATARESGYEGVKVANEGAPVTSDGSGQVWGYGGKHQHQADVVVVDEASMIDQALLFRVLDGTLPTTRLVFVGDHAQLPSVGPGHVLRELMASNCFPTVYLTEIYRQAGTSYIVEASHLIHKGEMPDTSGNEFRLLEVADDHVALAKCMLIAEKLAAQGAEFQVISPRHGGTVGVTNLNPHLRELLNPATPGRREQKIGAYSVREGDQVMVVRNDYKLGVFNGDVGHVSALRPPARELVLGLPGPPEVHITVPYTKVRSYLRLAYASTVHKNQGREVDIIVLLLSNTFGRQLQRNLLYTAVTRARKRVYIIGQHAALHRAILNDHEEGRNTLLAHRVKAAIMATKGSTDE